MYRIERMAKDDAEKISQWQYVSPYDVYNGSADQINVMLNPENNYHAIYKDESLAGFLCWGLDARVFGHRYCNKFTDVGLGMNPVFTGIGQGELFVKAILNFLNQEQGIKKIRFTVASFNKRALKVYEKLKFDDHFEFENPKNKLKFKIMRLEIE